jgi:hypothetical protein
VPVIFLVSLGLIFLSPIIGRLVPLLIPIVLKYGLNGLIARASANEKPVVDAD